MSRTLQTAIPRPHAHAAATHWRGRTFVSVLAQDPPTRAGVSSMLLRQEVLLLPPSRMEECEVLIVVARASDQMWLKELLSATDGDTPVVLVLDAPGHADPASLAALGVQTCVWRAQVSPDRLRAEILSLQPVPSGRTVDRGLRARRARVQAQFEAFGSPPGEGEEAPSEREIEVLRCIADGMDTAEIAERMRYSERTVKSILHSVTTRCGLGNRVQAVAYAIRAGWL
ncbi:hypothetical protein KIH74_35270 [Kineosporia sp. J2-2]|uniref:HTH luxR-type domain-containing protein n=1 Tax=Kineosporia corallincola TaxID=2835133 RepID=A0ABS5TTW9_9ACTN|nr:helix-turn-helix transcriptional regulator [Kineosporia corallincola]MBT0774258.1 hypothetical protein [Kineosporia corallincola]